MAIHTPEELRAFSISNFRTFWSVFLEWSGLIVDGAPDPVCRGDEVETAVFFPELRLNYTQNLLRSIDAGDRARPAVTALSEIGAVSRLSRGELAERVLCAAGGLSELGLGPGDRAVAICENTIETLIACLASTALGMTWSAVSADLGAEAISSRFAQLEPRVLFFHSIDLDGGAARNIEDRVQEVLARLPSVRAVLALDEEKSSGSSCVQFAELLARGANIPALSALPRLPWNHPLFILFTSGTTGTPKCIVHGAGGLLIEQHKEHVLHHDFGAGDKIYFHTTTGWMMWNWLLTALASGAEIVLYRGSAAHPSADALWRMVAGERITVFGTSPSFLQFSRERALSPSQLDLGALRAVLSTGSVLSDSLFHWVHDRVKPVPVCSISGGTDIAGSFLLGHPDLPVYPGEIQSASLGLDVRILDPQAGVGELICANPFPSRPLGFLGDTDGSQFHQAYFSQNPGVWTHGDRVEMTPHGGYRVHGRSDGVMKIHGIRIGPAEIYLVLESMPELVQYLAVEQRAPREAGESRLVLLVVLRPSARLDAAMTLAIKRELARRCSPAHVPAAIIQVDELPVTLNGKLSECAARDALNGDPPRNGGALRNPGCLAALRMHPDLRIESVLTPPTVPTEEAARRRELERVLLLIWEEALGTQGIDPGADFHDLGGHSLRAARILERVENEFHRRLRMGTFFGRGATVAGMVEELMTAPDPERDLSSLVAIQPHGRRLPLFLLPGGGGMSVILYHQISETLGHDQPVYGFEIPHEPRALEADIRDRARRFIRDLRTVRPRGPYALLGFSMGSFTAYEMGLQLRAAGEEVTFLAICDAAIPESQSPGERIRSGGLRIRYHLDHLRADPLGWLRYLRPRWRAHARAILHLRPPPRTGPSYSPGSLFDVINRHNLAACEAYARTPLQPYPGRIDIFLAEETAASTFPAELDLRLRWSRLAKEGFRVHRVAGAHKTMLHPPYVQGFAEILRQELDRIHAS